MKKFLSACLVFTLILSTLCILPVAAAEEYDLVIEDQNDWNDFVTNYATHADETIKLNCNVTATATLAAFSGTFDGGNNTITVSASLFESLSAGAKVQNLTLDGAFGSATERVSVSTAYGALAKTVSAGDDTDAVTLTNVVNSVDLYLENTDSVGVGGLVGQLTEGELSVSKCANNGTVDVCELSASPKGFHIGGFVGYVSNNATLEMQACVNSGAVLSTSLKDTSEEYTTGGWINAGGFVGRIDQNDVSVSFMKCVNSGNLSASTNLTDDQKAVSSKYRMGGFIGSNRSNVGVSMKWCVNNANLSGTSTIGGFFGEFYGGKTDSTVIDCCYNYGAVNGKYTTTAEGTGGFIAKHHSNGTSITITNSVNAATVTEADTSKKAGAFLGYEGNGTLILGNNVSVGAVNSETADGDAENGSGTTAFYSDNAEWKTASVIKGIGYQTTVAENGVYNVRFVSTITDENRKAYDSYGYEIIRYTETSAGAITTEPLTTVYNSLLENGDDYKEQIDADKYFATFVVTGVPANENVTFVVRPFVKSGDTVTYGNAFSVTPTPASAT